MIQVTMHRAGCNSGCICTRQTVKKTRRAREGRSPFDRAVPGSTCCRFSIRKAVQIYNVGTGRFLRRKIPFSREKSVSLQAPRPKNLRFLAETGEGGSGGGACFPVHQLVKTFLTSWPPLKGSCRRRRLRERPGRCGCTFRARKYRRFQQKQPRRENSPGLRLSKNPGELERAAALSTGQCPAPLAAAFP